MFADANYTSMAADRRSETARWVMMCEVLARLSSPERRSAQNTWPLQT